MVAAVDSCIIFISVEERFARKRIHTLDEVIEEQRIKTVKLQEMLAMKRSVKQGELQVLRVGSKKHKIYISHLETKLAEEVKKASKEENVLFAAEITSDSDKFRIYTGFDSNERFACFVEFVSEGFKQ